MAGLFHTGDEMKNDEGGKCSHKSPMNKQSKQKQTRHNHDTPQGQKHQKQKQFVEAPTVGAIGETRRQNTGHRWSCVE